MSSSTVDPVSDALLATDSDATSTQPSSHPPPQSVLSRLYSSILCQFDFSRKTLLYLRLLAFFIIEVGYIILAAVCLAKPISLKVPSRFSDAVVESGFTTIFVVWQIIAIFMATDLAVDAFSREWSAQLEKLKAGTSGGPPAIVPDKVDRVSIITSGLLDRALHLFFDKSSGTFKLAFLASLLFLALRSLGPGTIHVGTTLIDEPTTVQIGQLLSQVDRNEFRLFDSIHLRGQLIVQLEQSEHSAFGFKLPPNILAPVPKLNLTRFIGTIEYESDVIEFHYDCHWEAPQFRNASGRQVVVAAGQQWVIETLGIGPFRTGSSIGPLYLPNITKYEEVGTTAIIFAGGNSSFLDRQSNHSIPFGIDLGSLPTTFTARGHHLTSNMYYAPLSSVLVCDPHTQITGGRIRVAKDGTLTIIASGKKPIGNIPNSAANLIFASALTLSLNPDYPSANGVGSIASTLLMSNSSTIDWNDAHGIRPLDLSSINENMDAFMLSAAKACIDGFRRNGSSLMTNFELDTVAAIKRSPTLVLMTSKLFLGLTVALISISMGLLLVLYLAGLSESARLFDLKNVDAELREARQKEGKLIFCRNS